MSFEMFAYQGASDVRHCDVISESFDLPMKSKVVAGVAFATESGASAFIEIADPLNVNTTVYLGIRNAITSYQAILLLFESGVNVFVVDTGTPAILFHPKFYLAKSDKAANLVIGSANMTLGGFANNFEASAWIHFDFTDAKHCRQFERVASQLESMQVQFSEHCYPIRSKSEVMQLLEEGLIIDEDAVPLGKLMNSGYDREPKAVRRIKSAVSKLLTRVTQPKSPEVVRSRNYRSESNSGGLIEPNARFIEVWSMKDLRERDLSIPQGNNTNPTAAINLDKGLLDDSIDFRDYFYDEVFHELDWQSGISRSRDRLRATGKFRIIVKGVDHGTYELTLSHNISKTSPSYRQKNAMTSLQWGDAKAVVGSPALLGGTLRLYKGVERSAGFVISID